MERNPNLGKLQATKKPSSCSFMVEKLVLALCSHLNFLLCAKQTLLSHVPHVPTMLQRPEPDFTGTYSCSHQMSRAFSAVLNMLPAPSLSPNYNLILQMITQCGK